MNIRSAAFERIDAPVTLAAAPTAASSAAPSHEPRACDGALVRAFGFLGKRWNGVILGTLAGGPMSFSQLRRGVNGISDSVLSERLSELAGAGLISRAVDAGPPVTVSYRLAASGEALLPAMKALTMWARENIPADEQVDARASTHPKATERAVQ
ncbi:winged helix-turn-helix transcriptional regulator [Subtercola endophyticus]|uniref:winged helix-turn-helix transcriptional regulator n=1 Tax=Subtercola endophyticus TaxID=2895559 RepID=UPI001E3E96A1|nr:helix-turn-helix domain-containing protein [Subtercola endophyticus]UFS58530.1 helix-turn-helix transcriptional regulator [Subtercola endophyticus]